jgi:6-phosphogluconolactonase (cycloisomerase 2 family)
MKRSWGLALGLGITAAFFMACSAREDGPPPPVYKYYGYITNPGELDRDGDPIPPGTISAFAIDPGSGGLTVLAGSPFEAFFRSFAIAAHPSGKFLYVTGIGRPSDLFEYTISVFTINPATGALTRAAGSSNGTGAPSGPHSAAVHPSGKFIYVADGRNHVSAFTIDTATGALTVMAGSPFEVEYNTRSVAVDPSGKFAYVTMSLYPDSNGISAFTIDPSSGALTEVAGSPFAALDDPISITIDPSGKFAYVANNYSDNVSAFTIDAATGALAEVPGSPFATQDDPTSIAIYPTGKFVYVVNAGSDSISVFAVDPATGALAEVPGSPFVAGDNLSSIVLDPSGMFAYLHDYYPGLSAFKINPATGALTEVSGSPFVVGFSGGHHLAVIRIAQ